MRQFALIATLAGTVAAVAGPVLSGPYAGTYDITAVARNGRSGYEGVVFTPGHPSATAATQMNPAGAPAWSYGNYHAFEFKYFAATGLTTWSIDFSRDGDFDDFGGEETSSSTSPSLVNKSFGNLNLYLQGRTTPLAGADVRNFTVNGVDFGAFSSSNDTVSETFWTDTNGLFGDLTITGELRFSASGNSDERPRMWIRLGNAQELAVIPAPAAALLGLIGLGVTAWTKRRSS